MNAAVPMTVRSATILGELLAWLNLRFAPDGPAIVSDTPLFTSGLLNSLRVLELIAWTERAIGREIPDGQIRTDYFATASRIAEMFAGEVGDAQR